MGENNYKATEILSRELKLRREKLNFTLRDVATETGISASTLSRIEQGKGKPDADVTAALSDWLDIPLDRLLSLQEVTAAPVVYYPHESTPAIVEAHLRADKNLSAEAAEKLIELFREAYKQFTKFEVKK